MFIDINEALVRVGKIRQAPVFFLLFREPILIFLLGNNVCIRAKAVTTRPRYPPSCFSRTKNRVQSVRIGIFTSSFGIFIRVASVRSVWAFIYESRLIMFRINGPNVYRFIALRM